MVPLQQKHDCGFSTAALSTLAAEALLCCGNYRQLVWLPSKVIFVSVFVGFFLKSSHLIGFILTVQKYITKSSCILLDYISYTIFNLNFEVVMSFWFEQK